MSQKFMESLQTIADGVRLSFDEQSGILYGMKNGYTLSLESVDESFVFGLQFSLKQGTELPDAELLKQLVKESKIITNCSVNGYQVRYDLKTGRNAEKSAMNLEEVLELITRFLQDHHFVNCCADCGAEEVSVYAIGGAPIICCEECFKKYSTTIVENQTAQQQKKENIVAGIVGAILGSLIGVAAIVILGQLGYVAVISGLILAICTLKGYELLGGKLGNIGIVVSCLLMIAMVYFGSRLDWALTISKVYEWDLVSSFQFFPDLLKEGYIDSSPYYTDLGLLYVFTAIGAVPTIIGMVKERKATIESYKLG
ncbi:hypothetical protein [Candidatus Enterococcus willemsii]|uniref:Uncharacterized protein n=1 Tax=Candidatus Enterococcus willemsii TaxID=1857215 RepID=A0ABQ6Z0B3_9ENTE|nr:hypothetical protein [Enterococcus sp. CU12B]KAF1304275.1 hypothetical protein BAU17_12725 [Enterococcus sp. CU12B]